MKTKKRNYGKNKKVVKRKRIKGTFTQISYSVIRDKNLTPTARLLMIEILSDSADFHYSPSNYMKRLGISETAYDNAINNLIKYNYLGKTKIDNTHYNYYTISEYGNLKTDTPETSNQLEQYDKSSTYLNELVFINNNKAFLTSEVEKNLMKIIKDKQFERLPGFVNIMKSLKKIHYNDIKDALDKMTMKNRVRNVANKILKERIFEQNKYISNPTTIFSIAVRKTNKSNRLDYESLLADRADGI